MADIVYTLDSTNITAWVTKINRIPITDRNSNFEPILTSLKMEVKESLSFVPAIDDVLTISIDSDPQYQGRVKKVIPDNQNKVYVIEIEHGLFKLTEKRIDHPTLAPSLWQLGVCDFTSSSVVTSTAYYNPGGGNILFVRIASGHGISTSFVPVAFKLTASTDDQLIEERYFYGSAAVPPTVPGALLAEWFQVRLSPTEVYFGDPLGLAAQITGNDYTSVVDIDKFNYHDNENYSNVSVKQIFDCMADVIGMSFDYTDLSGWDVYPTYEWGKIVLDFNMFFALGQSVALNHVTIDAQGNEGSTDINYRERRLTFFDFFQYMMSLFGFSLHYKTDDTWEILKPTNDLYSYSPKEYYKKIQFIKEGDGNTAYGAESFNDDRSKYTSALGTTNDLDDGVKFDATLLGVINNVNDVNYISNLKLFLRDTASGSVVTSGYWEIEDSTSYRQDSIQDDFTVYDNASPIKTGKYTIKQHFVTVDLTKGKRSNIIQEST